MISIRGRSIREPCSSPDLVPPASSAPTIFAISISSPRILSRSTDCAAGGAEGGGGSGARDAGADGRIGMGGRLGGGAAMGRTGGCEAGVTGRFGSGGLSRRKMLNMDTIHFPHFLGHRTSSRCHATDFTSYLSASNMRRHGPHLSTGPNILKNGPQKQADKSRGPKIRLKPGCLFCRREPVRRREAGVRK